jgi:hypothetical protein
MMTAHTDNSHPLKYAGIAGLLYLIIIVCGLFSELFVRSELIIWGDAEATAGNILASQGLFRVGLVADSVMLFADVAIAVILYLMFRSVNRTLSLTAAAFRLTEAAILGFNLLIYYTAMLLLSDATYTSALGTGQLHALAMLFLDIHSHGYDLGLLFFGVSNLFLGYLITKSSYVPVILGYGLAAAALVYLLGSYARFLLPDVVPLIEPLYAIPLVAELAFCLWLLAKSAQRSTSR